MSVAEKNKFTKTDYQLLEEGAPFQLIDGELIISPTPYHQLLSKRIFKVIDAFLEKHHIEGTFLYAPLDIYLDNENVFQPDLVYISGQLESELVKDRISVAPDLIIEILSPSTAYYDLRQKKDFYERYGVKEYLIIDPLSKSAEVYILKNEEFTLYQKEQQNGTINLNTLPGLQIDLQKLFS